MLVLHKDDGFTLDNGLVRLHIEPGGKLEGLYRGDGPNLASSGYWNCNGNGYDASGAPIKEQFAVLSGKGRVVRQSTELVEMAFERQAEPPFLFATSLHYVLRRGEPGFYLYMTAAHEPTMPAGYIVQYAYNLRLNPEYFDYIAVDEARRHISHSCRAEAEAEAIMDATFRLADGQVVSKYNYTHAIEDGDDFKLYGWAGPKAGVWWIQGSGEYYGSAPFRVLLTSHQTAKTPAIIWQAHCTHRGGYEIEFPPASEERWEKVYGPVFVYVNDGGDYDALWRDAQARRAAVEEAWPFAWMAHELFPLARGQVRGQLVFDDGRPATGARLILVPEGVHWSKEHRGYHFWTEADDQGHFQLDQVRPGRYTLFALGADQFWEFERGDIDVTANGEVDLGTLTWQRVVRRQRLWQIGTADRSSGEFANGDDFHHWGLWRRYPSDFPEDVHFTIGQSQERSDWNFAHWNWHSKRNAWIIDFELDEAPTGTAVLTFGIAAARGHGERGLGANHRPAELSVVVNDQEAGGFAVASTGGDSYRSARQSTRYAVREVRFDAGLLRPGRNSISLRHALSDSYKSGEEKGERGAGPGCIIYDAIRLELD